MKNNPEESTIDTDVIIRFLTADDLEKQKAAAMLFEKVAQGKLILNAPATVIADTVYVLASPRLYHLSHEKIRDILGTLINLAGFKLDNKQIVLKALDIYAANTIDFGDAMVISAVENTAYNRLYSYDHDFDRFPQIKRIEP